MANTENQIACVIRIRTNFTGPYRSWVGPNNGKMTTLRLSEEADEECQTKIENFKKSQDKIKEQLNDDLKNAPCEKMNS
ncbi:MAG: hypothetical protein GY714_21550 [Desulfobacterales bacterium]|nr:hypothetical protein [Desulfobacterales bacterium]